MADTDLPASDLPDLASVSARLTERLRAIGVAVGAEQACRFASAVALARPVATREIYWLGRVTLAGSTTDIDAYDRVFTEIFRGLTDVADSRGDRNQPDLNDTSAGRQLPDQRDGGVELPGNEARPTPHHDARDDGTSRDDVETPIGSPASDDELLRRRDFADCTPQELADLRTLVDRLRVSAPRRPSRRRRPYRSGSSIDRRATLRRARRTGGHPVHLARRTPTERRRRVVLIADVSGSMESYSRAYLYLLHGAVRALHAETFVFATSLTRITRSLRSGEPERALRAAVAETHDWSGGTRIGAAIRDFNDGWGRRGMARGAIVVIVSDGWESEDPDLLGEQMQRLARLTHRIVWVNPRSKSDRYQPLVGGMAAALPHVDAFTSGHSLAALDGVLAAIAAD